jgi:hypothetical protein
MFSCHVFQHLPGILAIRDYLRDAFRVLRRGSSICFHLPVPGAHITSRQSSLWFWAWNLYVGLKRSLGMMDIAEYHRYRAPDVFALLGGLGFTNYELRVFPMTSNGDYHSYFFATRP